jgi:hypothetical protein
MQVPQACRKKPRLAILWPAVVKLDSGRLKEISSHTLHRNFLWRELQCSPGNMSAALLAMCTCHSCRATRQRAERLYNVRDRMEYDGNKGKL